MADTFNWTCPHCQRDTTIVHGNEHFNAENVYLDSADGYPCDLPLVDVAQFLAGDRQTIQYITCQTKQYLAAFGCDQSMALAIENRMS